MRALALLVLLAACDIQPPPKKQPPPASPTAPESPKFVAPAPPPMLPEQPKTETTAECIDVGKHVAAVFVSSVTDPAQKSVFEQERTKIVKATAEACTTQAWSAEARACYMGAGAPADIKACEAKFPPPAPKNVPTTKSNIPPGTPADQL
ncbi:MAG: hypothetical protein HOV81_35530 [Kofleriaceae bacterium]|nr:hypothetical protein [Kofleriaceae bacterium]